MNALFKWYLGCRPLRGIETGRQEEGDGKTLVCDKRTRAIILIYTFCCDLHLTLNFSGLLQNDLFKERWSLEKSYFKQNYSHACHTRLAVFFPLQSCCVSSQMTFSTSNNSLDNFTCWYAQFWKKQTTYPMRGWCSLQICISRRLLWLLPLVLYCHNGYEKYWQPSRPRTHANNTSIVKICPEQLVWASSLNTLSSFHYFPKFWSVSVPLEKKNSNKKQEVKLVFPSWEDA